MISRSCGTSFAHAGNPPGVEGPNSEVVKRLFQDKNNKDALAHLQTRSTNGAGSGLGNREPADPDCPSGANRRRWNGHAGAAIPDTAFPAPIMATPRCRHSCRRSSRGSRFRTASSKACAPSSRSMTFGHFDAAGVGDEFAILCALEFIGWLNRDRANPVVHGVQSVACAGA